MESLKDMLRRHEGLSLKPYRCTGGALSIGYGHNLDAHGISKGVAEIILSEDITMAILDLYEVLPETRMYCDARRHALVDMIFNLGKSRFLEFRKMLEALRSEDFQWAAKEMLDSTWAKQVGTRAVELAKMVEDG